MDEHPLHGVPNRDARDLLATGAPAYLFVNPVEYHGPHLSLDNDALVARGLARDLHERLRRDRPDWPYLTAGELGMGCGAVPGPGSRPTPFPRLRDQVVDACNALVDLGARRVVLMTFHGHPLHSMALEAGVRALAARRVPALAPMHLLLAELVGLSPDAPRLAPAFEVLPPGPDRDAVRREFPTDIHAGFAETSLSLHYAPASVSPRHRTLPACPTWRPNPALAAVARAARLAGARAFATEAAYAALGLGWMEMRPFPGYTGRPALARAEFGAALAGVLADGFAAVGLDVLEGRLPPPPPVLAWLEAASLQGRIG